MIASGIDSDTVLSSASLSCRGVRSGQQSIICTMPERFAHILVYELLIDAGFARGKPTLGSIVENAMTKTPRSKSGALHSAELSRR